MTLEMLIIAIVRILGSLPVLRWALVGGILALLTDLSDLFLMNLLDFGGVYAYQRFDKLLDQVYLLAFLITALRWPKTPRRIAIVLYLYRLAGFLIFEATGSRPLLLLFPNVFEFWFLYIAAMNHWRRPYTDSPPYLIPILLVLFGLKEAQEYILHFGRWLDGFTAVEAVEAIWNFLTAPFR